MARHAVYLHVIYNALEQCQENVNEQTDKEHTIQTLATRVVYYSATNLQFTQLHYLNIILLKPAVVSCYIYVLYLQG